MIERSSSDRRVTDAEIVGWGGAFILKICRQTRTSLQSTGGPNCNKHHLANKTGAIPLGRILSCTSAQTQPDPNSKFNPGC